MNSDWKYVKIIYVHCGEETNISDPRSYEHYWTSSWNKTWKKLIKLCFRNNYRVSKITMFLEL